MADSAEQFWRGRRVLLTCGDGLANIDIGAELAYHTDHGRKAEGQLAAWGHRGFWQPMDTLRDKQNLNSLSDGGAAPWKLWG